ncbi:MAG: hypothetical protein E4G98_05840 [Promethearchaeota archaeon]|nr:MAG: hypothetical protein E4G98_05840 [Candidatus Lokiarchaeota archaeon]
MENLQYILKNRQKSIPILAYSGLAFFLFIEIRNYLQPELYFQNTTLLERILSTLIMLSMAFAFFFFMNYYFMKKIIFTQTGIIVKKFLRKGIVIEWSVIEVIDFKICALDTSKTGSFVNIDSSDKVFVPNMKKLGNWNITIKTLEKEHKIKLYQVPFSNISDINPLIYSDSNSNLQYLSCQELNNPKTQELLWSWKSEGTGEEKQASLNLLEKPAMVIEHNLLFFPELEVQDRTMKNFLLFILVVITPLMYILILAILDITKSSNPEPIDSSPTLDLPYNLDLIFILFLGISILIIFVTYWFVLPKTMKKYQDQGYDFSYFSFFLLIALNEIIVLFGLIIGILSWLGTVHTDWLKFVLFVGIGWIQMLYLYIWKIPKDFRQFSFKFSKK